MTGATWVAHRILPGEELSEIAERYAADERAIARDNQLRDGPLRAGRSLRVLAARVPPARQRITYQSRAGDTWQSVAARHAVREDELRRWNSALGAAPLAAGARLRMWVPPAGLPSARLLPDRDARGLPLVPIAMSEQSYGRPDHGRLRYGAQMPSNRRLYLVRRPDFAWGSSHTVLHLQIALAKFRRHSSYRGPLVVSDMSQLGGGRYGPHRSHQSGRDVDLWLPLRAPARAASPLPAAAAHPLAGIDFASLAAARASEVDWAASWDAVKALIRTGEVQYIFLSQSRQRSLLRAALNDGFARADLADVLQLAARAPDAIVRHARNHDKHMHVRFRCASYEHHCM
jgi:murein endopeptidase